MFRTLLLQRPAGRISWSPLRSFHSSRVATFCFSSQLRSRRLETSEDSFEFPEDAGARAKDVASEFVAEVYADKTQQADMPQKHTLAILVDNTAGVLAKIVGLLSARGFNIDSLTVSPTNIPDLSRITVIIAAPDSKAQQALKQLSDVVNVWAVVDFQGTNSLQRELLMVKVAMTERPLHGKATELRGAAGSAAAAPAAVRDIGDLFGAEVVDVGSSHVIFQLTSWSRRIDAFIRMLVRA